MLDLISLALISALAILILLRRLKNAKAAMDILSNAYKSLEQGWDEQEENYEQQFLSMKERIFAQQNTIDSQAEALHDASDELDLVRTEIKYHREHCLPHLYGPQPATPPSDG